MLTASACWVPRARHPGGPGVNPASVHIQMGTFGKALGVAGAFVGAVASWWSTWSIFPATMSTAPICPAQACAVRQSIELVRVADEARAHLARLVARFRQGAGARLAAWGK